MKVYVLEWIGDHEAGMIIGVYSNREQAELASKNVRFGEPSFEIHEFELNAQSFQ